MLNKNDLEKKEKIVLKVNQAAPNFVAIVQYLDKSEEIDLYKFLEEGKSRKVLLVFYPGDDTPGCTKQLCGIRDIYKEYQDLGVTILGVNPSNEKSHQKFIEKYNYQFGIVVDKDKEIREKYGAIGSFFGNATTKRSVYLIDSDKKILFIQQGQQNDQEILELLKNQEIEKS